MFNYNLCDLSHTISENIPVWPGSTPFSRHLKMDYDQLARVYDYQHTESIGTHIDAPAHFFKEGKTIDELPLTQLVTSTFIIDVRNQVNADDDYLVSTDDIDAFESKYRDILPNSLVVAFTGWSEHWNEPDRYLNRDDKDILHFPGFSKEAAKLLLKKDIAGIGIDTISLDPGNSTDFPVHHLMLGNGKIQIENLTNLHLLPPIGAYIAALPLKIAAGPEAPARVIGFVPC